MARPRPGRSGYDRRPGHITGTGRPECRVAVMFWLIIAYVAACLILGWACCKIGGGDAQ